MLSFLADSLNTLEGAICLYIINLPWIQWVYTTLAETTHDVNWCQGYGDHALTRDAKTSTVTTLLDFSPVYRLQTA